MYYSKEENDVLMRENVLKQLYSTSFTKELLANDNPNDSADSEEDTTSPRKNSEKQTSPSKKLTNYSLTKVATNRVPVCSQSPLFMERPERRVHTDARRGQLQIPRVIDILMAPLKLSRPENRRAHQKDERSIREKFEMVSLGALSPMKNSLRKRVFHYGANFHFPQLKP